MLILMLHGAIFTPNLKSPHEIKAGVRLSERPDALEWKKAERAPCHERQRVSQLFCSHFVALSHIKRTGLPDASVRPSDSFNEQHMMCLMVSFCRCGGRSFGTERVDSRPTSAQLLLIRPSCAGSGAWRNFTFGLRR